MGCYSSVYYIPLNFVTNASYVMTNSIKIRAKIQISAILTPVSNYYEHNSKFYFPIQY